MGIWGYHQTAEADDAKAPMMAPLRIALILFCNHFTDWQANSGISRFGSWTIVGNNLTSPADKLYLLKFTNEIQTSKTPFNI